MEDTLARDIVYQREKLAKRIKEMQELEKRAIPPAVQELVLARRSLEDARMRTGVALAYLKGDDPWTHTPKQS